jgi:hypothetical protein
MHEFFEKNLNIILLLEWLGVRMENVKEDYEDKTVYYYSVPESSTIEVDDTELNARIKTADGLKLVAKEALTTILVNTCRAEFSDDEEFIAEIQNHFADYFQFYAKVRYGEVWTKEYGDERLEKIKSELTEYQEV